MDKTKRFLSNSPKSCLYSWSKQEKSKAGTFFDLGITGPNMQSVPLLRPANYTKLECRKDKVAG